MKKDQCKNSLSGFNMLNSASGSLISLCRQKTNSESI